MKENNEISQIAKEINEKLSYEFEKNKRIVDCLNQFERIVEKDPSFIRSLVIKKSPACYFRLYQIQNKLHKGSISWREFSRRTCLDGFRSFIPFKR